MITNADIHIRDPFVLPVADEGRYYLFGSTDRDVWTDQGGEGFDVYVGEDLAAWDGPHAAFRPPVDFWGRFNFWAPEVHAYRGKYYMLASFKAHGVCRGTAILAADSPLGPFVPHSNGPVTPRDWECLDGTFYLDPHGRAWMVFCHEWTQVTDGEICAMMLREDLTAAWDDPILLFRASDAPWVVSFRDSGGMVTDGPFLHRAENGWLLMLWSSFTKSGYAQGVAHSRSGEIIGPWEQEPDPLYISDGGHGMLFGAFDGQLTLSLHTPNATPHERPIFLPVREDDGRLEVIT